MGLSEYVRKPEINKQRKRAWYEENKRHVSLKNAAQRYGISVEQYEEMEARQNNLCAICNHPPRGNGKEVRLHVDHDHTTGNIRGLLCKECNSAIGQLNDDPELLEKAINYLREEFA